MKKEFCPRCKTVTETFYNHTGHEECGQCAQSRRNPKVMCGVCQIEFKVSKQHAHLSGEYYCSEKCYSKLFLVCLNCGQKNMGAKTNLDRHNEQLCDDCYDKKHGLVSVTIGSSQYRTY